MHSLLDQFVPANPTWRVAPIALDKRIPEAAAHLAVNSSKVSSWPDRRGTVVLKLMTAERATRGAGRAATLARATVMEALRAAARRRTADCMTGGGFVVMSREN